MGTALTRALSSFEQEVVKQDENFRPRDFARLLPEAAGIREDFVVSVDPQELTAILRRACSAVTLQALRHHNGSWAEPLASSLLNDAAPLLSCATTMSAQAAANIRIPALMLAAEADAAGLPETAEEFRHLLAGITLLEKRANGKAPLETILLARE